MTTFTSSACNRQACVVVQVLPDGWIGMSGSVDGQWVSYSRSEWVAFIAGVKQGDFDATLAESAEVEA